ncbi:MAG: hypothetical protein ACXWXF_13345 [Aeromicrobium sp.]
MPRLINLPSRALRPHAIHSIALIALVAACNVGGGPSATPNASPTASPTPAGTLSPTASPTKSSSPTFNSDQIAHPTGATDIVLRMEQGGGFVPFEWMVTQAPQFTLYGDGTVVFRPIEDPQRVGFEQGLPRYLIGKMTEEGIQALLLYALDTGRLANAKDSYDNPMIADAGTTVFNLNAGGEEKVVSIYALFEMPDLNVPDAVDRTGFSQLQTLLMNFEQEVDAGTVSDVELYEPELYRVVMLEGMGEPTGEPIAWPWDDLTPDDFPAGDEPGGTKILDAGHVADLVEVPSGGQMGVWVEAPDGSLVQFAIRPLLPDEVAATDL